MAGIYLHIPFCKQACHYCEFHFSTTRKHQTEMVQAIAKELVLRKGEMPQDVETIYFGGGTPSLLNASELEFLLKTIYNHFKVSNTPEITLEANPDDLSEGVLQSLKAASVNRLSIGAQSFFEEDLLLMNRAHNASEAITCIENAQSYFENISIDLIYGMPKMTAERWLQNLDKAFQLNVPHLSCYALTVEPKTALKKFIEKGTVPPVEDELAQEHHALLVQQTEERGYVNYEFSNFGKPGFESQNNLGYWLGKPYLGVGPSAHSFDGNSRSWNIRNNSKYIQAIMKGELPLEREHLSLRDHYNEYVMTRLRTQWGINLEEVETRFNSVCKAHVWEQAQPHLQNGNLLLEGHHLKVSAKGKFLSDGIASDLFLLHLERNTQ